MTDPRDRIVTDPGIGPVDLDNSSTVPALAAAEEIEPDGASLYYEPKPLVSVSDHKTLEVATVRLAEEIDPRKLKTELALHRTPRQPAYDSGWPQAEVVLTSSQRPMAATWRWRVPAVLLISAAALLLLVIVRGLARHAGSGEQDIASTGQRAQAARLRAPVALKSGANLPSSTAPSAASTRFTRALSSATAGPSAAPTLSAAPTQSAASRSSANGARRSTPAPSATSVPGSVSLSAPARTANALNHGLTTPSPPSSSSSTRSSNTESPSGTKPIRAIY